MNMFWKSVLLAAVCVQPLHGDDAGSRQKSDDAQRAILAAAESYAADFNERDAEKLAKHWSESATYVLPNSGEKLVGRKAIQEMFQKRFAESKSMRLTVNVESIRLVTPDVAVETGMSQLVEDDGTVSHSGYTAIHVKQGDRWLLDSIHDVDILPGEESVSPLAELEWMIGEWIDQSEESTVETVCQWTKNKAFLTRTFRVVAPGTDELEGTQVIGWDPISNQIRSWVFDSDGGFSEGTWKHKGDSWVVETAGFIADGRPTSSIQVYARADTNSFTWQSFGRRVEGELLPNIDEIKVIRKSASDSAIEKDKSQKKEQSNVKSQKNDKPQKNDKSHKSEK